MIIRLNRNTSAPLFDVDARNVVFRCIVGPRMRLQLCRWQFSHKETLYSRHSSIEVHFSTQKDHFVLSSPPLWLEATNAVHLILIGNLLVDFLLVIIELFFASCFRFVTIHAFHGRTDEQTDGFVLANTSLHTMPRGKNVQGVIHRTFVIPACSMDCRAQAAMTRVNNTSIYYIVLYSA